MRKLKVRSKVADSQLPKFFIFNNLNNYFLWEREFNTNSNSRVAYKTFQGSKIIVFSLSNINFIIVNTIIQAHEESQTMEPKNSS